MAKSFPVLVRLAGFGPAACGLEVRCSIQLSYRRCGDLVSAQKTMSCGYIFCYYSRSQPEAV
jgi:hypothetical protein